MVYLTIQAEPHIYYELRDAFQFQFLDNDNLEENAILDIDLDKLDTSTTLLFLYPKF